MRLEAKLIISLKAKKYMKRLFFKYNYFLFTNLSKIVYI